MIKPMTITRTGQTTATPQEILATVSSTAGFTSINPHVTADPNLRITPFGPTSGVGAGFKFQGKDGKGIQTITAIGEDYVEYGVDLGAMGKSTQRISATPSTGGGSNLAWTTRIPRGFNPLQLVFRLFADKVLGPTMQTGIKNLNATVRR